MVEIKEDKIEEQINWDNHPIVQSKITDLIVLVTDINIADNTFEGITFNNGHSKFVSSLGSVREGFVKNRFRLFTGTIRLSN